MNEYKNEYTKVKFELKMRLLLVMNVNCEIYI